MIMGASLDIPSIDFDAIIRFMAGFSAGAGLGLIILICLKPAARKWAK